MKITVLGCGASPGVPHLIYGWGSCNSSNPKNNRTRSSVLVEHNGATVLIDTSPDLRQQLMRLEKSPFIDAVLFSHVHFDHTAGLGDLRPLFYGRRPLVPLYAKEDVLKRLLLSQPYLFENETDAEIYQPIFSGHILLSQLTIVGKDGDMDIQTFEISHGYSNCTGFRISDFAYTTDVVSFPEESFKQLYGLKIWIVDCLCREERPSHAHLDKILKWVDELRPKMTYLTHMDFSMDYDTLLKELPANMRPAYDNLVLEI